MNSGVLDAFGRPQVPGFPRWPQGSDVILDADLPAVGVAVLDFPTLFVGPRSNRISVLFDNIGHTAGTTQSLQLQVYSNGALITSSAYTTGFNATGVATTVASTQSLLTGFRTPLQLEFLQVDGSANKLINWLLGNSGGGNFGSINQNTFINGALVPGKLDGFRLTASSGNVIGSRVTAWAWNRS